MSGERDVAQTYTLSSLPPLAGLFGVAPVTLLVGLEDAPDGLRAYLGTRHKGIYLLVPPEAEQAFRRAWGNAMGHTWLYPVPPADELHRESEPVVS